MKKVLYLILILVFVAITGCKNIEPDIFSASAAERMNAALKDDFNALTSADNGWAVEYFANPQSPGYTLLIKFNSSGLAIVASKSDLTYNQQFQQDSCLFEMIADNGPVLTFNTFSKVLHRFSNPENPDGYGLEGDYEFIVLSKTEEQMIMKGKKKGAIIVFNKIPLTISWNQYIADLDAMNSTLFSATAPKLSAIIGSTTYTLTNGYTHVFNIQGSDLDLTVPFIITRTGFRFQSSQLIAGLNIQRFILSADKTTLECVENSEMKMYGISDLNSYFATYLKWKFLPEESNTNVKTICSQINQSFATKFNADSVKIGIAYNITRRTYQLNLAYWVGQIMTEGNLDLTMTTNGKSAITFGYKATGDTNGLSFYSDIDGVKDLLNVISNGFLLTTHSAFNPENRIKFTKKTDVNSWFTLSCN